MKLTEIVAYLNTSNGLDNLYKSNNLNRDSEYVIVYMKDYLEVESDVYFFDVEETNDDLIYNKYGIQYFQLFPLDYIKELFDDFSRAGYNKDSSTMARRLLEYRIKDA